MCSTLSLSPRTRRPTPPSKPPARRTTSTAPPSWGRTTRASPRSTTASTTRTRPTPTSSGSASCTRPWIGPSSKPTAGPTSRPTATSSLTTRWTRRRGATRRSPGATAGPTRSRPRPSRASSNSTPSARRRKCDRVQGPRRNAAGSSARGDPHAKTLPESCSPDRGTWVAVHRGACSATAPNRRCSAFQILSQLGLTVFPCGIRLIHLCHASQHGRRARPSSRDRASVPFVACGDLPLLFPASVRAPPDNTAAVVPPDLDAALEVHTRSLLDQVADCLVRPRAIVTRRSAAEHLADHLVSDLTTPALLQQLACAPHPLHRGVMIDGPVTRVAGDGAPRVQQVVAKAGSDPSLLRDLHSCLAFGPKDPAEDLDEELGASRKLFVEHARLSVVVQQRKTRPLEPRHATAIELAGLLQPIEKLPDLVGQRTNGGDCVGRRTGERLEGVGSE